MDWFPITVTTGRAFCNRVSERQTLKEYIKNGRHTVLHAPRRYGKTSLINQVLIETKLPHTIIELTMATSLNELEKIIIHHIGSLLREILPTATKAKQAILKLFLWLNPEIVLTAAGQKIVFHPKKNESLENIAEILKNLDDAAKMVNKKIVVVMDEFQQLATIEDHNVEASIRHAMQYSQNVSYIFSGSNRNMLISMFNKKNRPLYNACETMVLERISKEDYIDFINKAALDKWKKTIPPSVLERIFQLTELHPIYVNRVCGYFWLKNEFPSEEACLQFWKNFVESQSTTFTEDLLSLSANQRTVLSYLSHTPISKMSSFEVIKAINLPETSIRQAVKELLLKDYIYKNKNGDYQVLDPSFRDFILTLN